jgi:tetratricopeptide (TPR) repeat protein
MKKIPSPFKHNILLLLILIIQHFYVNAQWYDPEKVNPKAANIYTKAYEAAETEMYGVAMKYIATAITIDPNFVDAYLTRAGIYANMKKYDSSVYDFEKGIQLDSIYSSTYYLPYSISLAGVGKFEKALIAVNEFLQNNTLNERSRKAGNYRKSTYEFAIDYEKQHPSKNYVFTPKNLGDSINSEYC